MGQHHVAVKFHSIEIKSSMMVRRFCSPLLLIWSQASPPLLSHVSFNITVKTHGREEAHFLIPLALNLFGGTKVKLCQFLNAKVSHGLIHCCYHFIPRQRHKKARRVGVKPFTTVTVSHLSSWSWIYLKRQNVQISPRRWRGARVWPASEQFLCGS